MFGNDNGGDGGDDHGFGLCVAAHGKCADAVAPFRRASFDGPQGPVSTSRPCGLIGAVDILEDPRCDAATASGPGARETKTGSIGGSGAGDSV